MYVLLLSGGDRRGRCGASGHLSTANHNGHRVRFLKIHNFKCCDCISEHLIPLSLPASTSFATLCLKKALYEPKRRFL